MAWTQPVYSTNVASVGHGPEGLTVEWRSGKVSLYGGVDEQTARSVANSVSPTDAINTMIKPHYAHRYVQGDRTIRGSEHLGARGKAWR